MSRYVICWLVPQGLGAGNSIQFPIATIETRLLESPLLPPSVHFSRKLELVSDLELEPRHLDM